MPCNFDSIWTSADTSAVFAHEQRPIDAAAPDIGIGLSERAYALCGDDWIVSGLLALGAMLILILYRGRRLLAHHLKDIFAAKQHSNADTMSDNASEVAGVLLLVGISALSLGVIYFNDLSEQCGFNPVLDIPYWTIGVGFVVVMCLVYLKAWLYTLINWVFFDHESRRIWIQRYFFLTSLTAFAFYPLAVIDVLVPSEADIAAWGVILILFLYEILLFYRLLSNFQVKGYSYVLIYAYFCSVELVPALILWNGLEWMTGSYIIKHIVF